MGEKIGEQISGKIGGKIGGNGGDKCFWSTMKFGTQHYFESSFVGGWVGEFSEFHFFFLNFEQF